MRIHRSASGLLPVLMVLMACGDSSAPRGAPSSVSAFSATVLSATVGEAVSPPPAVRVTDAGGGALSGVEVSFAIQSGNGQLTGALATTNADGVARVGSWVMGTIAGPATLAATVDGLPPVIFTATANTGSPAALRFVNSPAVLFDGQPPATPIQVEIVDSHGNRVTTATNLVSLTAEPGPAAISVTGTVNVAAVNGVATFSAVQVSSAAASSLSGSVIAPAVLSNGAIVRIDGAGFGATPEDNMVLIDGVAAPITSASTGSIILAPLQIPEMCTPTRAAEISVSVNAAQYTFRLRALASGMSPGVSDVVAGRKQLLLSIPLQSAPQLTLAAGESAIMQSGAASRCFELPQNGGRYMFSVYSAESATVGSTSFVMRGTPSAIVSTPATVSMSRARVSEPAYPQPRVSVFMSSATRSASQQEADSRARMHSQMLQRNARFLTMNRHPLSGGAARTMRASAALLPPPALALDVGSVATVGAVNDFRYSFDSCGEGYTTIRGRTAWVGQHAIIVEDEAPFGTPVLNGTLDSRYAELGAEFDAVVWPLIQQNFGDPLAVDANMANHGRIIMIFTPRVNSNGAQAFVYSCDFFPRSEFPKSNEAAIFYSRLPSALHADTLHVSAPAGWQRVTRSTIVHETKHIASYAERIMSAGTAGFEEPWLEEGGARIAEEIYARIFNGNSWKENRDFRSTFLCDVFPYQPGCAGKPFTMAKHFGATISPPALYDFLERSEIRSVLCLPVQSCFDATYYASAWSMIRWATDHFAVSEAQFLSNFTRSSTLQGAAGMEQLTQLPWTTIMGEWSLMLATDDIPGFTPQNPRLRMLSWNLREVFGQLHLDAPGTFSKPYPLTPQQISYGSFLSTPTLVVNGGFAALELSGAQNARLLMELQGLSGSPPDPSLRIAVVRLQ